MIEALGVTLPRDGGGAALLLERCGMTLLFAPLFHPSMRHVGPIRRELAVGTIMNILGPLANPAGVRRQVVGVADPARAALIAEALPELECEWALVVHAPAGMDEIAPVGPTDVWEVRSGSVQRWTLEPSKLGFTGGASESLAGGSPADNAAMIRSILAGKDTGARRTAVVLNAAAALLVAGIAEDWPAALQRAGEAIASGAANDVLERLVRESRDG